MELTVVQGDITAQDVDAVVNAANRAMRGGGGVDGAIHRAGGPAVLEDCIAALPATGWRPAGRLDDRRRDAGTLGDPRGRAEPPRRRARPLAADLLLRQRAGASPTSSAPAPSPSRWSRRASTAGPSRTPSTPPSRRSGPPTPRSRRRGWWRSTPRRTTLIRDAVSLGYPVKPSDAWDSTSSLDHVVDAGGEGLDVGGVDRRGTSRSGAGCGRACGRARCRRCRWRAGSRRSASASIASSKSMVPITSERWSGSATYGVVYDVLSAQP